MNRHEQVSHFYASSGLNEQGQGVIEALGFSDYREAMQWVVTEFIKVNLDWHSLEAGSPYPISLPNVMRQIEKGTHIKLEDEIKARWNDLSKEEKSTANNNFEKIFGSPELAQGRNESYCREKFDRWMSFYSDPVISTQGALF
jgi:hypothetical protein